MSRLKKYRRCIHQSKQLLFTGIFCLSLLLNTIIPTTTEKKHNMKAFPGSLVLCEVLFVCHYYIPTDHRRNQSSKPALGLSTPQDIALQCWIQFHRYTVADCNLYIFFSPKEAVMLFNDPLLKRKNTFSQFDPDMHCPVHKLRPKLPKAFANENCM